MNSLHLSLTEEAFRLKEAGKVKEAAWILKYVHFERHKPKGKRKRKVRLKDSGKAGEFYLDPERLKDD